MAETYSSDNTNEFSALLKRKLREDGMLLREASEKGASEKELEQQKVDMMKTVYRMLVYAYGELQLLLLGHRKSTGNIQKSPRLTRPKVSTRKYAAEKT